MLDKLANAPVIISLKNSLLSRAEREESTRARLSLRDEKQLDAPENFNRGFPLGARHAAIFLFQLSQSPGYLPERTARAIVRGNSREAIGRSSVTQKGAVLAG